MVQPSVHEALEEATVKVVPVAAFHAKLIVLNLRSQLLVVADQYRVGVSKVLVVP